MGSGVSFPADKLNEAQAREFYKKSFPQANEKSFDIYMFAFLADEHGFVTKEQMAEEYSGAMRPNNDLKEEDPSVLGDYSYEGTVVSPEVVADALKYIEVMEKLYKHH